MRSYLVVLLLNSNDYCVLYRLIVSWRVGIYRLDYSGYLLLIIFYFRFLLVPETKCVTHTRTNIPEPKIRIRL
jgi:hypothetical protein